MDVELSEEALCSNASTIEGISRDDCVDLAVQCMITNDEELWLEFESYTKVSTGTIYIGTIYCHAGSTTEAYAIANGAPYELTHFFEGEWTYDYDQMIRWRKCIHCDELETEDLETTSEGNVEIVEPVNPDTKFEVDEFEKNSDNYILIENTVSENLEGNFEILKVFDINLKNKDGVHVQPDGTVKVKLPLDWSKEGDYKVYRVNDDGTLTDMNAYRQGSHMVFDTDHFSIYVTVEENVQGETPEVTPDEEIKDNFFDKILDWFRTLLDLILSWFNK